MQLVPLRFGRPDEEKIKDDGSSHGTLWQRVKCAMQSDDAIAPECRKRKGKKDVR
jgi:hypothetical protein